MPNPTKFGSATGTLPEIHSYIGGGGGGALSLFIEGFGELFDGCGVVAGFAAVGVAGASVVAAGGGVAAAALAPASSFATSNCEGNEAQSL